MTQDRRFKHRVRRRMRERNENYVTALAAERASRPPRRTTTGEDFAVTAITRMRAIHLSVSDMDATRAFDERIGATFEENARDDGIVYAMLGGVRLILQVGMVEHAPRSGAYLLFDVTDADATHHELVRADVTVTEVPRDEPWGRQFDILDPDGYLIALIGPRSA